MSETVAITAASDETNACKNDEKEAQNSVKVGVVTGLSDEIKAAVQVVVNGAAATVNNGKSAVETATEAAPAEAATEAAPAETATAVAETKNVKQKSISVQNDADSARSRDSLDREITSINETNQDQIKNSEESSQSNYEDLDDSNSPYLIKQINSNKKKETTFDNGKPRDQDEKEYDDDDDDDYEDEDEDEEGEDDEIDQYHDDDCEDDENKETKTETETSAAAVSNKTNERNSDIQPATNEIKSTEENNTQSTEEKTTAKLAEKRLSRQTSASSNNSPTTPVNPALAPVKKGNFFEHDTRDDEKKDDADDEQPKETTTATSSRKNSIDQSKKTGLPNVKPHKLEHSTSESNEQPDDEKWRHDMFEKQQNSEIKSKPQNRGANFKPRSKPRVNDDDKVQSPGNVDSGPKASYSSANQRQRFIKPRPNNNSSAPVAKSSEEPLFNSPTATASASSTKKAQFFESKSQPPVEQQQQPVEPKKQSKGLSLSEYLGQENSNQAKTSTEPTDARPKDQKPNRRPNIQPYQPQQRFSNNNNTNANNADTQNRNSNRESNNKKPMQSNESDDRRRPNSNNNNNNDLQKRLDFSTRKPINASNFIPDNLPELNDIDYVQQISPAPRVRSNNQNREDHNQKYNLKITTQADSSKRIVHEEPSPVTAYASIANNPSQARFNANRKPQFRANEQPVVNQLNQQQPVVVNFKSRNPGTYDEYFVPEDEHLNENANTSIGYTNRPKKHYENNNKFSNNDDFNQQYQQKQQPMMPQSNRGSKPPKQMLNDPTMTYNDYLEYSGFNQHYSNNNNNNAGFAQVKSQSYSNSNYKNNRNQNDYSERAFKSSGQQYQQQQPPQFYQQPPPPHQQHFTNSNRQQFTNMQHFQPQQQPLNNIGQASFNYPITNENTNFIPRQNNQHNFQQQNF